MDRFYIIPNSAKDPELTFSNMIIDYLEEHGARCHVQKITEKMEGPYHYTDPDGIPEDTQCIIVLGGDGTLAGCKGRGTSGYPSSRNQSGYFGISCRGG